MSCFVIKPSALVAVGTCILHLTSSTGVRTREVTAPATPPVQNNAERGKGTSELYNPEANSTFCAACSETKRLLFSNAAPTNGALIPRYKPATPSLRQDCLKQSSGPAYRRGLVSGCDCSRTLTVSNGYSMNFPAMPAILHRVSP